MAVHKLSDVRIGLGGLAVHSLSNMVRLTSEVDAQDVTTFGNGTKVHAGGLFSVAAQIAGFNEYGTTAIDAAASAALEAGTVIPAWFLPDGQNTEGGYAFFFNGLKRAHTPISGNVGEYTKFDIPLVGAGGPLVRGQVLRAHGTTTTGVTTGAVQVGAVSATQKLYALVAVLSMTGTAVDVTIQSDNLSGFGSPASALVMPQITVAGSVAAAALSSANGAITDDYFRAVITVTGGNADVLVLVGVR
jgi:hypothetical protein